jgi:hypothetical protein
MRGQTNDRPKRGALCYTIRLSTEREALRVLRQLIRMGYGETVQETLREPAGATINPQK